MHTETQKITRNSANLEEGDQ